jgi:hypothetical protein
VRLVALLIVCALAAPAAAQDTQPGPDAPPVSLDRIREQLSRPPPKLLQSLEIEPDFTVTVEEEQPRFVEMFSPEDFRGGPTVPGGSFALDMQRVMGLRSYGGLNLLAIGDSIVGAISRVRRRRAEEAARLEVQRAMAEFCAAQPDGGLGVHGCAGPPP